MSDMTHYDLYDDVVVWDAYPQLMVYLILLSCLMTPLAWYVLVRETSLYERLSPRYRAMSLTFTRLSVCYTYLFLLGALLHSGYHAYSLRTYGEFPTTNMNLECAHLMNTDDQASCCSVYTGCSGGPHNTLDHDTYLFKWSPTRECPTLLEMIPDGPCEATEFGCCQISTTCDTYSRLQVDYETYQDTLHSEFHKGFIETTYPKTDANGTGCPTDKEIIDQYLSSIYETRVQSRVWFLLLFTCVILTPLFIYRKDVGRLLKTYYSRLYTYYTGIELSEAEAEEVEEINEAKATKAEDIDDTAELMDYDIP